MKKIAVLALSAMFLTSCGTKTIVVEKAPETTTTVVSHTEQEYIDGVTADFPSEVATLGKVKIVELGHLMCQSIDEGVTISDLVNMATRYDVDAGFIGAVIREAVHNFCPENQWFIDSALNA